MKLRTEMVDFHGRMLPRSGTPSAAHFATEHDAACAHALMEAMEQVLTRATRDVFKQRASKIMAGWGFDSGEVEGE